MKTNIREMSPSAYARFAGVLYLIITVAAIFAHMVIPEQFIVAGDTAATAANIAANETTFRLGMVGGELIILLSEIVLSVVLYVLLKPVNKTLSLVAAVSRLAMTTIHGLNLLNYYFVLHLLNGADFLTAFNPEQVNALVTLFLDAHSIGFTIGIAFLVPHVLILGYLIVQSGYFPKVLGFLFIAAGIGYLVDAIGLLLVPSYTTTPGLIAMVIAAAEIAFPIWLLVKGVNMTGWQQKTVEVGSTRPLPQSL
ncbi:MAG: DUF4386 domain-containing protein [Chloroflexi bacterium]|nr:DUF4386 domain-containing protein [Chloroflexota bacterium]MBK6709522.1 DUF4386 domain-containing protein [Chloroflexota bacterium]MBK7915285.1 DUF4386 domain-containing protein [Chloroflexota bacterium]MBK8934231.1 DUF4386 domain-containing protein [Chloroflexota bacterium]MBP6805654.1 DUF4386 domain-containing protein [Chloroflexota bacterium]